MRRRCWLALLFAAGCPRTGTNDPEPRDTTPTDTAPATAGASDDAAASDDGATPSDRCGDASTTFADATALPDGASLVAVLALTDADLSPALRALADRVGKGDTGLPVPDAFALAQWPWQVPLVRTTIDALGMGSGQLVAAHGRHGATWIVPLGCSFEAAARRLDDAFEVDDVGTAAIATPRDRARWAYDVIVTPSAIVLCPPGRARQLLAEWSVPAGVSAPPPVGKRALELDAAPIRLVARPAGLLDPDATSASAADVLVRVDAAGVELVPQSQ